jgi:hypothetical protein
MQDIFDPDNRPIDDEEAGPLLGVKPTSLPAWRSQGKGPRYYKTGRTVRYTPRLIREYLESRVRVPEPASVRRQRRALAAEAASTT